jgi:hypothetical protein
VNSLSRTTWTLCFLIALAAIRADADVISADKFADATLTVLSLDQNRDRRVGGHHFNIIVLAPPPSAGKTACPSCDQAIAIKVALDKRRGSTRAGLEFDVESIAAPRKCSPGFLTPSKGTGAIVAVDLPLDCVRNLFSMARQNQILTISTRKDDIEPISIGIVSERNQVVVYRSDVALKAEGVRLAPDFLSLTRSVASNDYRENYREAMRAVDFGNWKEAERRLQIAKALKPEEGGEKVVIYGVRIQTYLPHYYLGLALFNQGDCDNALEEWKESERQGVIHQTSESQTLSRLRQKCLGGQQQAP